MSDPLQTANTSLRRRKTRGVLLLVVGVIFLFVAINLSILFDIWVVVHVLPHFASPYILFVLIMPPAIVYGISVAYFFSPGLRKMQPTAEELLALDPRPPVVFLRSFVDESIEEKSEAGGNSIADDLYSRALPHSMYRFLPNGRAESDLALLLKWFGPVIAIGRPGEKLQLLGASRAYCTDDVWQQTVTGWIQNCRLTVMMFNSPTPGTEWELSYARSNLHPSRFVLYLPGSFKERELHFATNRTKLKEIIGHEMPPGMFNSEFLCFNEDWTPRIVTTTSDLLTLLDPGLEPPPFWRIFGAARLALFAAVVGSFALELAFFIYVGFAAFR